MKIILQRFLVITFFTVVCVIVAYSCAAIKTVSNYHLNIAEVVNRQYVNEKQTSVLVFYSETEAFLSNEEGNDVYSISSKDNVIYLTKENTSIKHVIIPFSDHEIMWQNKNTYLYYYDQE